MTCLFTPQHNIHNKPFHAPSSFSFIGFKRPREDILPLACSSISDITLSVSKRRITPLTEQQQHISNIDARSYFVDPLDHVRDTIAKTIDEGLDSVDLSNYGLYTLPGCIQDLAYLVTASYQFSSSLKLFLNSNHLSELPQFLFTLKNLSVLILRHNYISRLPPEVALLENLKELSISNNELQYIPYELLRIENLKIVHVYPNPFIKIGTMDKKKKSTMAREEIVPLQEVTMRQIFSLARSKNELRQLCGSLPKHMADSMISLWDVQRAHVCARDGCGQVMISWCVEKLEAMNVFGHHNLPVLKRFCRHQCASM